MPRSEFNHYRIKGWLWVIEAYPRMLWVLICLKLAGFKWLRARVEFQSDTSNASLKPVLDQKLIAMHESVRLASRLQFFAADCLPRSLVLKDMLTRRGISAKVVIGVAKTEAGIASHAWVEADQGGEWQMVGEAETVGQEFVKV